MPKRLYFDKPSLSWPPLAKKLCIFSKRPTASLLAPSFVTISIPPKVKNTETFISSAAAALMTVKAINALSRSPLQTIIVTLSFFASFI